MNKDVLSRIMASATVQEYGHGAFGEPERYSKIDHELLVSMTVKTCLALIEFGYLQDEESYYAKQIGDLVRKHFGIE